MRLRSRSALGQAAEIGAGRWPARSLEAGEALADLPYGRLRIGSFFHG